MNEGKLKNVVHENLSFTISELEEPIIIHGLIDKEKKCFQLLNLSIKTYTEDFLLTHNARNAFRLDLILDDYKRSSDISYPECTYKYQQLYPSKIHLITQYIASAGENKWANVDDLKLNSSIELSLCISCRTITFFHLFSFT